MVKQREAATLRDRPEYVEGGPWCQLAPQDKEAVCLGPSSSKVEWATQWAGGTMSGVHISLGRVSRGQAIREEMEVVSKDARG